MSAALRAETVSLASPACASGGLNSGDPTALRGVLISPPIKVLQEPKSQTFNLKSLERSRFSVLMSR